MREWILEQIEKDGGKTRRSAFLEEIDTYLLDRRSASGGLTAMPGLPSSRATLSGGGNVVAGIGVPFMAPTIIGATFTEQFHPRAFEKQRSAHWARERWPGWHINDPAKAPPVVGLWAHDTRTPLASVESGTLGLETDKLALHYSIEMPATAYGDHVAEMVRRRDVTGASIGFTVLEEEWVREGDMPLVTVLEAALAEVSILWNPAYPQTTAELVQAAAKPRTVEQPAATTAKAQPTPAAPASTKLVRFGDRYEVVGPRAAALRKLDARGRRYAREAAAARQARIDTLEARGKWGARSLPPGRGERR